MARDWSSRAELRTSHPGRIKAMALCAMAEKQKRFPLLMLPKARARKLMRMVAEISKTVLYVLDNGAMTNWSTPKTIPRARIIGMSMKRAEKKTETAALAKPYMMTVNQTG